MKLCFILIVSLLGTVLAEVDPIVIKVASQRLCECVANEPGLQILP